VFHFCKLLVDDPRSRNHGSSASIVLNDTWGKNIPGQPKEKWAKGLLIHVRIYDGELAEFVFDVADAKTFDDMLKTMDKVADSPGVKGLHTKMLCLEKTSRYRIVESVTSEIDQAVQPAPIRQELKERTWRTITDHIM
jgi:hypothetical protein